MVNLAFVINTFLSSIFHDFPVARTPVLFKFKLISFGINLMFMASHLERKNDIVIIVDVEDDGVAIPETLRHIFLYFYFLFNNFTIAFFPLDCN